MFTCILIFRRGSYWKPFERKIKLLHLPESQWSDNILYAFRIRQWPKLAKKIRTEIETPFYPKRQPFNIIRLFCSNWVAMFSSDCRLWTKLKESKYEIANSVTICWNRVFSKFFCLFKPNMTLLEIKVGLTCCSISLLPLSWPFPVRNIVQWKCWCWGLHFK